MEILNFHPWPCIDKYSLQNKERTCGVIPLQVDPHSLVTTVYPHSLVITVDPHALVTTVDPHSLVTNGNQFKNSGNSFHLTIFRGKLIVVFYEHFISITLNIMKWTTSLAENQKYALHIDLSRVNKKSVISFSNQSESLGLIS